MSILGKFLGFFSGKFRQSSDKVDTNVIISQSLAKLEESVASVAESSAKSSAKLEERLAVLMKTSEVHTGQLTSILNNQENAARTNEDEIGQAAVNFFEGKGKIITDDCLVIMDDALAVVEVKSTINSGVFKQLRTIGKKVEDCQELRGQENEIILVVGAPNFPTPLKAKALKSGFIVIQLSGARYGTVGLLTTIERQ